MSIASALLASAAVLLVTAGVAKLLRPATGVAVVVGLRTHPLAVRALASVEIAAGAAALWLGGPVPALVVGLLYAAFAVAVWRALRTGAESCGCFGRLDAAPSRVHVGGNLALAVVSFAAAGSGTAPAQATLQELSDRPAVGVALVVEVLLVAGLGLVAFTALAEALGARRPRPVSGALFVAMPSPAAESVPPRAVEAGSAATDGSLPATPAGAVGVSVAATRSGAGGP